MDKFLNFQYIFETNLLIKIAIKMVTLIIIFILWPKLINILKKFFLKITKKAEIDELLVGFIESIITVIMYIILFYLVIAILGFKATSLVTILGTASLAVGLALQGSLTNLAGGVLILFFRPFKKGDSIKVEDIEGEVLSIQMIYTKINTWDNQVVIVPNAKLANSPVTNFSVYNERRLTIYFSVSHDNNINKVIDILKEVAEEEKRIIESKAITIRLNSHTDNSLQFIFRVWVNRNDYFDTMYTINENVKLKFIDNNIKVPHNIIDIYNK